MSESLTPGIDPVEPAPVEPVSPSGPSAPGGAPLTTEPGQPADPYTDVELPERVEGESVVELNTAEDQDTEYGAPGTVATNPAPGGPMPDEQVHTVVPQHREDPNTPEVGVETPDPKDLPELQTDEPADDEGRFKHALKAWLDSGSHDHQEGRVRELARKWLGE